MWLPFHKSVEISPLTIIVNIHNILLDDFFSFPKDQPVIYSDSNCWSRNVEKCFRTQIVVINSAGFPSDWFCVHSWVINMNDMCLGSSEVINRKFHIFTKFMWDCVLNYWYLKRFHRCQSKNVCNLPVYTMFVCLPPSSGRFELGFKGQSFNRTVCSLRSIFQD